MKYAFAAAVAALSFQVLAGTHAVNGYVTKNGTYVAPHYATNANNTKTDNFSSQGNVNPYTGKEGKVDPYAPKTCATNSMGQFVCR